MQNDFKILYRYSDKGNVLGRTELKGTGLEIATRKKFLTNFINVFGTDNLYLVADNCEENTIQYLSTKVTNDIEITNLGNTKSFKHVVYKAIDESESDDQIVYLVEDDYVHAPNSEKYIRDGLETADYISLYDSLDKYFGSNNPLIHDGGEDTLITIGKLSHYKRTNATTCSFSTRIKTLKEDLPIIKYYCPDDAPHPMDYLMFRFLITQKHRTLVCPIPGKASHWGLELSPFTDWISIIKDIKE